MGNLLGAPVTEKETHIGVTEDGLPFGVSSMQGWRVHMEDAHIAETKLYASELLSTMGKNKNYQKIDLPGHSFFAVFDGHGGTFAAMYSGRNMCRVLSRQPKFVEYAKFIREREEKEKQITNSADRVQYITAGLELVEAALCNAFIDIDKEIASALQGTSHPDADMLYHPPPTTTNQQNNNQQQQTTTTSNNTMSEEEKRRLSILSPDQMAQAAENINDDQQDQTMQQDHNQQQQQSAADSTLQLLEKEGDSGTTACVVLVAPQWVVCANAGDSRAVFSKLGNKPVPLSYDHKPDDEEEERRIRAAGGYVAGGRVEGDLAVSRGLGDFRFKDMNIVLAAGVDTQEDRLNAKAQEALLLKDNPDNANNTSANKKPVPTIEQLNTKQSQLVAQAASQKVSPVPDVIIQNRSADKDEFILLCCDGIWDVQSNYDAVNTIAELFKEGESHMGLVSEEMCDICLNLGSKDNMTVLAVKFDGQKVGQGGGVMRRRQLRNDNQKAANGGDNDNEQTYSMTS